MPGEYPKTHLSFDSLPLEDLRDPVLNGPGVGVIEDSVAAYRALGEQIGRTAERVRSALSAAQAASEGEAADASRRFIESVAAQGDHGAAQAAMAARALGDQAEYHARVRTSMEALKRFRRDPAVPATSVVSDRNQPLAVEAANLYQSNTNWNLDQAFQPFDPPPAATPNMVEATSAPGAGGDAGSVGMHSAGALGAGPGQSTLPAGGSEGVAPSGSAGPSGLGGTGAGAAGPAAPFRPGVAATGTSNSRGGGSAGVTGQAGRGRGTGSLPDLDLPPYGGSAGTTGGGGSRSRPGLAGSSATSRGPRPTPGPGGAVGVTRAPGGSGWTPGTSWSSRLSPEGGAGVRGEAGNEPGRRPAAPPPVESTPAGPRAAAEGRAGQGGVPFLPGGAGARSGGAEHPRPAWLIEEDEKVWFDGLPPLAPPVIRPERS
jgi:hypothetical protein